MRSCRTPTAQQKRIQPYASPVPSRCHPGKYGSRISEHRIVDRLQAIERAMNRRQRILKACGAIEQHYAVIFADAAVGKALLVGGIGRSALRAQEQALLARDLVERGGDILVRHRDRKAFALAHRAENKKISDRL